MESEIEWMFQKVKQNVNKIENRREKVRNLEDQSNGWKQGFYRKIEKNKEVKNYSWNKP